MINVSVVKFCRFTKDSMDVFLSQINFNEVFELRSTPPLEKKMS